MEVPVSGLYIFHLFKPEKEKNLRLKLCRLNI